jgi:hypothetical protein
MIATGDALPFDLPIGVKVNAANAVNAVPTAVAGEGIAPHVMLAAAPNPIAGSGAIRFVLAAPGWTRIALFDVAGRRVRTLFRGNLQAGPHRVAWDGRNDRGVPLPAAVYFARLESGATVMDSKIVLIDR